MRVADKLGIRPSILNRLRGHDAPPPAPEAPAQPAPWPDESFTGATTEVVEFFAEEGIDLAGARLADIGCGDGVMDLGVARRVGPEVLVGFDIEPVDDAFLLARARTAGVADQLPACLRFQQCGPDTLPADDDSFDYVFSWSAFEHVTRPVAVLREVRRVLRPGGVLMIQLWPFYHSKHGSHLWDWFPDGFCQLLWDQDTIEREVRAHPERGPAWVDQLLAASRELNRITVDDLHRALMAGGFRVDKLQLLSECFHIPPELAHLPLSTLAVSGVKLLAVPS